MPLTAACTSIGLVTIAFVARGEKYRKWLKSAEWVKDNSYREQAFSLPADRDERTPSRVICNDVIVK